MQEWVDGRASEGPPDANSAVDQLSLDLAEGDEPELQLRPFFGFYGGKWRDAIKHYPAPEHDTIVEPFAGSAGYSLRYPSRKVVLCEKDPVIAGLWEYLIGVSSEEIRELPDVGRDQTIDDLSVCEEAKWLIGFWLNRGTSRPRRSPSAWMRDGVRPGSFWGARVRETVATQVDAIRHWQIYNCSYEECPVDFAATWFIDPPYEGVGHHYKFGSTGIDYAELAGWCRSRSGQVIVCENDGATWLPFAKIADVKTTRSDRRSVEVSWHNEPRHAESASKTVTAGALEDIRPDVLQPSSCKRAANGLDVCE
jgi:site-specific DNA-adenine methylase